jgi:DNA-binding beta-propeller fold protein YncE
MIMEKSTRLVWSSLFIIFLSSCQQGDEIDITENTIFGKWTVESGDNHIKYMILNVDSTYHEFRERNFGFRETGSGKFQLTEGQINFSGKGLFNYTLDNNQLAISNMQQTVELIKDHNAPDVDEWVKPVSALQSFDAPIEAATDIAFDGLYLWYGNAYTSPRLHKINPVNSAVQTLPINRYAWGIEWADGDLWVSHNGFSTIHKIDPNSGSAVFESVGMGPWIQGIAFDGQYLWCASDNNRTIYMYNPETNSILSQFFVDIRFDGMGFINGYLYTCNNGIINKCSVNPFGVVDAYALENGRITGITHDGTNFWLSVYYSEPPNYRIQKVELQ